MQSIRNGISRPGVGDQLDGRDRGAPSAQGTRRQVPRRRTTRNVRAADQVAQEQGEAATGNHM